MMQCMLSTHREGGGVLHDMTIHRVKPDVRTRESDYDEDSNASSIEHIDSGQSWNANGNLSRKNSEPGASPNSKVRWFCFFLPQVFDS